MSELDKKILAVFPGLVVRKDLVKTVRGNAVVPTYVLEYLLGQYCAGENGETAASGVETVREILRKHYARRDQAELIRSRTREKGRGRVIDKISVTLNDREDVYEAEFANLGLKKVLIDAESVKNNPKALAGGVWCIADVEYAPGENKRANPWLLSRLKPVQLSSFDYDGFVAARREFGLDEWIDLLVQTIGFNPALFDRRGKLCLLARLAPFCERNYNLLELGPKGTGKSHVYSEFSPHGILLSGGEVTAPKLFVNNANGRIGLVGYWDCVAFDEFAGKNKRADKSLVDIMKNYMANKSFSRGIDTVGAEASLAFVGNTSRDVGAMLKTADLFRDLPDKFYDSAFLDRLHAYLPGWESDVIRAEMFSSGYGFVVDYLAEILRSMRDYDYSDRYQKYFRLSENISTRDRDGVNKTFSGLLKLLFPEGDADEAQTREILEFAIEGRKRVKDQLLRLDSTFAPADFYYTDKNGEIFRVTTREEREYPDYYAARPARRPVEERPKASTAPPKSPEPTSKKGEKTRRVFAENSTGASYDDLFGAYLADATEIILTDPYIREFYQCKNLMDFLEMLARRRKFAPTTVRLVTVENDFGKQVDFLTAIKKAATAANIDFDWSFDQSGGAHARHIAADTGWKILLDRGLDIFRRYDPNDSFSMEARFQELRPVKAFEVTYLRVEQK